MNDSEDLGRLTTIAIRRVYSANEPDPDVRLARHSLEEVHYWRKSLVPRLTLISAAGFSLVLALIAAFPRAAELVGFSTGPAIAGALLLFTAAISTAIYSVAFSLPGWLISVFERFAAMMVSGRGSAVSQPTPVVALHVRRSSALEMANQFVCSFRNLVALTEADYGKGSSYRCSKELMVFDERYVKVWDNIIYLPESVVRVCSELYALPSRDERGDVRLTTSLAKALLAHALAVLSAAVEVESQRGRRPDSLTHDS